MSPLEPQNLPNRVDYALVLMLVVLSGNMTFLVDGREEVFLVSGLAIVALRLILQGRIQARILVFVLLAYIGLFFGQALSLDHLAPVTIAGFLIKLTIAASVVATVCFFRLALVRVMVWLTALSFFFHIPNVLGALAGVKVYEMFRPLVGVIGATMDSTNDRVITLFHTFQVGDHTFRNSGIFWEPAIFSGYLNLTLVLLATISPLLPPRTMRKWRKILVAGVISTMSTTGYIILPFTLFTFQLVASSGQRQAMLRKMVWFTIFAVVVTVLAIFAWRLDFIGTKIIELYMRAANEDAGWQLSRFGAILFDWPYIQQRPLFGWGQSDATQYALHPYLEEFATGNGFTGYMRQLGLTGMAIFWISLWVGLGRLGMQVDIRVWIIAVVTLQLNGHFYLNLPLYMTLHFIGLERHLRSRRTHPSVVPQYSNSRR